MRKPKSSLSKKTASVSGDELYMLNKIGIKVYPVNVGGLWFIESNNNNNVFRFEKSVAPADINNAVAKTVKYYLEKLKTNKN